MPSAKAAMRLDRLEGGLAPSLAENLPIAAGKPQYLAAHLRRLAEGAQALGWPQPDLKRLSTLCRQAITRNRAKQGSLRLRLWGARTGGPALLQVLPPRPLPTQGIRLLTSAVRHYGPDSLTARAKAAQMLPNWLASAETRAWADDGLRLTPDGFVAEGVWSNIVAIKRKAARTPPLHQGILEGVTRAQLLVKLRRAGMDVREEPLTRYDLWTADQVWLTSSLRGALKVKDVDGRPIG
jgi:branched-chain amino acid aminotransferase